MSDLNPCDTCELECWHFCAAGKTGYLNRQNQINEYARVHGIVPGAPDYKRGVDPCTECERDEFCTQVCCAKAKYWDERMVKIRKDFGL